MTNKEFKVYNKSTFGDKETCNYRSTEKRFYDERITRCVNTPQGLAQIAISTDKNNAIIDIEAGLILGRDAQGKNICDMKHVRNTVFSHYQGQPFDFIDFYYIGEMTFPKN